MIDCGLSMFAIWRRLQTMDTAHNFAQLQSVVVEPGPYYKFFIDNSMVFRSAAVEQFAGK